MGVVGSTCKRMCEADNGWRAAASAAASALALPCDTGSLLEV